MEKITNVQALTSAIATLEGIEGMSEVVTKLTNIKNSYENKNAHKSNKPTKVQQANAEIKSRIIDIMVIDERYQAKDIVKLLDNEYTNQKISALLKAIVEENDNIEKVSDKKVTYFTRVA